MKAKLILSFVFCFFINEVFAQTWVNSNKPFKNDTPTPTWNTGNYLRLVYELDIKQTPDTAVSRQWCTTQEIQTTTLYTEINISSKTYKVEIPGVALKDGKFTFKLYASDFDNSIEKISATNWQTITTKLQFIIKSNQVKETASETIANNGFQGISGVISDLRAEFSTPTNTLDIDFYSSHDVLRFNNSKVYTNQSGALITSYMNATLLESSNEMYHYSVRFKVLGAFKMLELLPSNGNRVYVKIVGSSTDNPIFSSYAGTVPVSYKTDFAITEVANTNSIGANKQTVRLTVNQLASDIFLSFDENPLSVGQQSPLKGRTQDASSSTSNIFVFDIPTDASAFKYNKYKFHFDGKDVYGNSLGTNSYYFEKKPVNFNDILVVQENGQCTYKVTFSEKSEGDVKLVFKKTGDSRTLKKDGDVYILSINIADSFIKDNLSEKDGIKYLSASILAYGFDYQVNTIKILEIDTKKAADDLSKISGSKSRKKDQIREYLSNNGFVGNMEGMTDSIFSELSKKKEERNWSMTWQSVAKFIKPAAGLLMLLV